MAGSVESIAQGHKAGDTLDGTPVCQGAGTHTLTHIHREATLAGRVNENALGIWRNSV